MPGRVRTARPRTTRPSGSTGGIQGLEDAARWYRVMMAWDARLVGTEVKLRLGRGLVAFLTPGDLTARVMSELRAVEAEPPIVVLGQPERGVFIADANDRLWSQRDMPRGVIFLGPPTEVPLPPTVTLESTVRWAAKPCPNRRWLPSAETIFGAIKAVAP